VDLCSQSIRWLPRNQEVVVGGLLSPFCGITKEMMSRGPQVADMECRETT
jgi:hypothetical protein